MVQGILGGLARRLAVGGAVFGLLAGGTAWVVTQPAVTIAMASQGNSDRSEDAKEAKSEKECEAAHTAKFCRDQARDEDKKEKADEDCDQKDDHEGKNSECETYGGSGDSRVRFAALDAVVKPISSAGLDPSLAGTAVAGSLVVGTLLLVAVRRRRIGRR